MEPESNNGEWDDEIPPSADPQIRRDYASALGEFLVAFNSVENVLCDLITLALQEAKRELPKEIANATFSQKVTYIELVTLKFPNVVSPEMIKELRQLGSQRNVLAHGHFDQNPFDGSYVVIGRKSQNMPVAAIHTLTSRANEVHTGLRASQAFYHFSDVVIPDVGN